MTPEEMLAYAKENGVQKDAVFAANNNDYDYCHIDIEGKIELREGIVCLKVHTEKEDQYYALDETARELAGKKVIGHLVIHCGEPSFLLMKKPGSLRTRKSKDLQEALNDLLLLHFFDSLDINSPDRLQEILEEEKMIYEQLQGSLTTHSKGKC